VLSQEPQGFSERIHRVVNVGHDPDSHGSTRASVRDRRGGEGEHEEPHRTPPGT
jgi:hypothetical protein